MSLPIRSPFPPMEALLVDEIPVGTDWQYEPKWDGFRCLVFRDKDDVQLQSKSGQPLTRYFPELVEMFQKLKARQFILDGEIAVPIEGRFSFDELLQRIHPARSRVLKLAREHPALFVAFDLLAGADGESMVEKSLRDRRAVLEEFARKYFPGGEQLRLSPATTSLKIAKRWFETVGGDLDGIIEVSYDHFTGDRFRHGTKLLRWRPDKKPEQCRMEQVERSGRGAAVLLAA